MMELTEFLDKSKTAYHAVENVIGILSENGFKELKDGGAEKIEKNGKYFVCRDGSSLVAFRTGEKISFNVVATHADSPCFKLKLNPSYGVENYRLLSVESYGGGLFYTWLDRPLRIAGRVVLDFGDRLEVRNFISENTLVIPSVAIHYNRNANESFSLNAKTDMNAVEGIIKDSGIEKELSDFAGKGKIADYDLYIVSDQKPFFSGYEKELLSSPRIDDLASVYASVGALLKCDPKSVAVCYIADNEEVGSMTKQGAGSTFLSEVLTRISKNFGVDENAALSDSFMLSFDNAHAVHPNHPELSDGTNKVLLGGGVVIKHHANRNYTTDALSSATVKNIFDKAGVKRQDFFMRSDLRCGGTLGAISSTQVSIKSADIGLPQLAMHSAVETMAYSDEIEAEKGLVAFYGCTLENEGYKSIKVKL